MAKDDDDDLSVVEGGEAIEGETVVVDEDAAKEAAAAGGDERTAQRVDDEDDAPVDGATEAIREQRRAERRAKKQREHAARDRNRRELDFLRQRNEQLERRFSQIEQRTYQNELRGEYSKTDNDLATIERQLREADTIIAKGISESDGATVTEAQNIKQELLEAKQRLSYQKGQVAQAAREIAQQPAYQPPEPEAPQISPELLSHANRWKERNAWYTSDTSEDGETDREIAKVIDNRLAQEGFDPSTKEYWDELTDRLQQRLPHRFGARNGSNGNGHSERRGPAMANGARERNLRPGEMYVSPERKEALIQAGAWEDPKLRQKYLKAYAKYDAEASSGNN